RFPQKVATVFTGVVRDASNHSLLVQERIIKRRNRAHVNSAEYQHSAFIQCLQRWWYQLARGRKNDRRIKLRRRGVSGIADPGSAQFRCQRLVPLAIARTNINFRATRAGHLNDDMTCGAKAVNSETRATPAFNSRQP